MLIGEAIEDRMRVVSPGHPEGLRLNLPYSLKPDRAPVCNGLLKRLASSRSLAFGDRAGVLRAAQSRSDRVFRLDIRHLVTVKPLACRRVGRGTVRAGALAKHIAYLGRAGAGGEGARPEVFDGGRQGVTPAEETGHWVGDRGPPPLHHLAGARRPDH